MEFIQKHRKDIYQLLLVYAIFAMARLLFIVFMPHAYSKDLYSWLRVIDILKNEGDPYSTTDVLNWPPFWMQILYGVHEISKYTTVSPTRIIQLVLIGGEAISILPCYIIMRKFFNIENPAKLLILGFALDPVCILLSCQHCNFDVFVGFWVLIFVASLLLYYRAHDVVYWLMACFFLGLGILTKTVPVILSPLLFMGIRKQKASTIIFGMLLLLTPVAIGMSIIFSLGHTGVMNNVIAYRSMSGWYGVTGILGAVKKYDLIEVYRKLSPVVILCIMLYLSRRSYLTDRLQPPKLIAVVLLLLISLPTFGPGYSPPYISWYLPLIIILYGISAHGMRIFLLAGYIIVAITYIIEYAFFDSHGAFLVKLFPSGKMTAWSNMLGAANMQVLIRLPMFAFYIGLCAFLVKVLVTPGRSKQLNVTDHPR